MWTFYGLHCSFNPRILLRNNARRVSSSPSGLCWEEKSPLPNIQESIFTGLGYWTVHTFGQLREGVEDEWGGEVLGAVIVVTVQLTGRGQVGGGGGTGGHGGGSGRGCCGSLLL